MGVLFQEWTASWGLRGDPYLWEEMKDLLSREPLPASVNQLIALLERAFEQIVGCALSTPKKSVYVDRFDHGGMSSGHVCFEFWRDRVFPELQGKYLAIKTTQTAIAKPCRFEFYPEGCRYGASCRFRHSYSTTPPSIAPRPTNFQPQQPRSYLSPESIPPFSNEGMNSYLLNYPSGQEKALLSRGNGTRPAVCIHFLRGKCTFGGACRFSHF